MSQGSPTYSKFLASEQFWQSFYALPSEQKDAVRKKWEIFKENPFDGRLGTHRINRLSALYRTSVYSVVIEGDLRVTFSTRGSEVHTIDVGTHKIYR